jgi:hypothetical protein
MQTTIIPGFEDKTPVAQMHFASEHLLSQSSHRIKSQKITLHANPG